MAIPTEVVGVEAANGARDRRFTLKLADNARATARTVICASGARYRRLDVAGLEAFEALTRTVSRRPRGAMGNGRCEISRSGASAVCGPGG